MFRSVVGALFALFLAVSPAAAEPFKSFVDLCLSANADGQAAEATARSAGWTDISAQMAAEMGEVFRDPVVFVNFDPTKPAGSSPDDPMELLVTGWGDGEAVMGVEGVVLDICGVMSPQADVQAMRERLSNYLGTPSTTKGGETVWLYSRQGARFVSEAGLANAEDEIVLAAARERNLYAVFVLAEDGLASMVVGAVRSAERVPDR